MHPIFMFIIHLYHNYDAMASEVKTNITYTCMQNSKYPLQFNTTEKNVFVLVFQCFDIKLSLYMGSAITFNSTSVV